LILKGRSLPEDVHKFYAPLIDWVNQLEIDKAVVKLKLEYLNSSSTKKLLNLLTAIDQNEKIKEIDVKWHYEFDDLDMEDLGSIYEEDMKRAKFQYIEEVDVF
ncbi:MAG TPA: SiaC family regulatory phosphoprotein, partial [Bacteroidales bacterium]|nr:SiaC family regulatory phosphoprotein [Bacteroidales bacterium]